MQKFQDITDPAEILEIVLDPKRGHEIYDSMRRMRELAPIYRTETKSLHSPCWIMTSHDACHEVLNHTDMHSDSRTLDSLDTGPGGRGFIEFLKKIFLYMNIEDHDRVRGLCMHRFSLREVIKLRPMVQSVVDEQIKRLEGRKEVDLIHDVIFSIPTTVIMTMLGVSLEDLPKIYDWMNAFARRADVTAVTEEIERKGEEATAGFIDYFTPIIADRRKQPKDDLITFLVQAEDPEKGPLTEEELVATCVFFIQAGHETTINLTARSMFALLQTPDQMALLRERPDILKSRALDELLRWDTSVNVAQRVGDEDVQIGEHTIPAGEVSMVFLAAANRDPMRYPDPDVLDLTREKGRLLSFGFGRHVCVGTQLARLEIEVMISSLFAKFPDMKLAVEPSEIRGDGALMLRALESLPVYLS